MTSPFRRFVIVAEMRTVGDVGRHRDRVTHSRDLEHQGVEPGMDDGAAQGSDHATSLGLFGSLFDRHAQRREDRSARRQARCAGVRASSSPLPRAVGAPPRQAWQSARARASAASAG